MKLIGNFILNKRSGILLLGLGFLALNVDPITEALSDTQKGRNDALSMHNTVQNCHANIRGADDRCSAMKLKFLAKAAGSSPEYQDGFSFERNVLKRKNPSRYPGM